MTIDSSNPIGSASPIGSAEIGATGASPATDAARAIGLSVVSRVLGEFGLGDAPTAGGDVYGLGELTEAIAAQLPAGDSTSQGALARAVEAFAGAVAEDVAARADGLTLDRIDRALGDLAQPAAQPGLADLASVTDFLETAAARLGAA